ncbi:aminotransferase class III-fold pyridoxal phosphate-dependent enzyme [Colwellia sp. E2M01]|uniref:aminotransferase class III-fold pyridoxal phosphate-dependent enzyme n=1 Tax=Colwellia sp. E2M01 TaxID=2841561 RepID=UPI001C0A0A32|nr:aminotransferase class III-fold pyridoxal phosphate-dependent enzyme [Colwellia sp. E2M01]MBU2871833.1 aminotransferase class III-fold pyridoxal phosphate-dependent enzyme [Colwellia sp. E2M01]
MEETYAVTFTQFIVLCAVIIYLVNKIRVRLALSKAKHPSLRGHSKWSRRLAKCVKFFEYKEDSYFAVDGAPATIQEQRKQAFHQLKERMAANSPKTIAFSSNLQQSVSDLQFTSKYRVPFPFRNQLPKPFTLSNIVKETRGTQIKDLDGNWRYDLSGSYGVNVFGYDFYKSCMQAGSKSVADLGPVLGPYHPIIAENVELIKNISGLDEVSFHMSGTEAVMQAVRLARYNTGKKYLVRFCGAYHGWWDGVQPGVGNQRDINDVYTLNDQSEQTLHVLSTRNDIACVLINPLQAFHPNADSASDVGLIGSLRATNFDKAAYSTWLKRLREICTQKNIVLIFDEVFTGFRLGYRGAQQYFDVQADMVTYGKTIGGGLPIGVVASSHTLMKRYKDKQPAHVSLARGTFNSHPSVMASMNEFLIRIQHPDIQQQYEQIESVWDERVAKFNERLQQANLPLKITNMQSILSVIYTKPSRYNWMFQFYLRANNLELSWIGSGRMIMSFDYTDADFDQVITQFITAAEEMAADGWWWQSSNLTNKTIKQQFVYDMVSAYSPLLAKFLPSPLMSKLKTAVKTSSSVNAVNIAKTSSTIKE